MSNELIAVFDSGVDFTHEHFGLTGPWVYEALGGWPLERLRAMRRAAIRGELSEADLAELAAAFPYGYQFPESARLCAGRDFAGLHPDYDLSDTPQTNVFDLNGHGTATAGILTSAGYAVLPVKVGYSLVPEISLPGLVEACSWLASMVSDGLPCAKAVWTFGSSDAEARPIYLELVQQLADVGITIWASGRGILERADIPLWPADLEQVIAVDEELHLGRYTIEQGAYQIIAYGQPGSTDRLDQLLDANHGEMRLVMRVVTEEALRENAGGPSPWDLTLVVGAKQPYVFQPDDEVFLSPVLVTLAHREDMPFDRSEPVLVRQSGTERFRPTVASPEPWCSGRTGLLAPVALNPRGWVPTFGSSCAAPSALRAET